MRSRGGAMRMGGGESRLKRQTSGLVVREGGSVRVQARRTLSRAARARWSKQPLRRPPPTRRAADLALGHSPSEPALEITRYLSSLICVCRVQRNPGQGCVKGVSAELDTCMQLLGGFRALTGATDACQVQRFPPTLYRTHVAVVGGLPACSGAPPSLPRALPFRLPCFLLVPCSILPACGPFRSVERILAHLLCQPTASRSPAPTLPPGV